GAGASSAGKRVASPRTWQAPAERAPYDLGSARLLQRVPESPPRRRIGTARCPGGTPMKAVVFHAIGDIRLEEVPEPRIQAPTDAIVRLTASAICGTDLHMIRGTLPGM